MVKQQLLDLLVWGHRGCRQNPNFYENSRAAHSQALKVANGYETDVVGQPDVLVEVHDTLFTDKVNYELAHHLDEKSQALLASQPQQPPYLYKLDKTIIRQLTLKDGSKLPDVHGSLSELAKYPQATINLELKGPSTWQPALKMVDEFVMNGHIRADQIVFSSFNHHALAELRQAAQDTYKIGLLYAREVQTLTPTFPDWPDISEADRKGMYVPFSMQAIQDPLLKDIRPDYFNLERSAVRLDTIEAIAATFADAKIIMWTAGEEHPDRNSALVDTVKAVYPTGKLHAVITDFPTEIMGHLKGADIPVKSPSPGL